MKLYRLIFKRKRVFSQSDEAGFAGKTNWNTLDTAGFTRGTGSPPLDTLNSGNINGKNWIPAECDVSIRPGWFYHKAEDSKVKTPEQLFDLYLKSVGRGANLLLNVPPDGRGLITEYDSSALVGLKKLKEEAFKKNISKESYEYHVANKENRADPKWKLNDGNLKTFVSGVFMGIEFEKPQLINCIVLRENIIEGQNCKGFQLTLTNDKGQEIKTIKGTTIGNKLIITFSKINISNIALSITGQKSTTLISEIESYLIDEKLIEK